MINGNESSTRHEKYRRLKGETWSRCENVPFCPDEGRDCLLQTSTGAAPAATKHTITRYNIWASSISMGKFRYEKRCNLTNTGKRG